MSTEKYKVGDKVKVKPGLDVIYNRPEANSDDHQQYGGWWFDDSMKEASDALDDFYKTDCGDYWTDEMLDGLYMENDK